MGEIATFLNSGLCLWTNPISTVCELLVLTDGLQETETDLTVVFTIGVCVLLSRRVSCSLHSASAARLVRGVNLRFLEEVRPWVGPSSAGLGEVRVTRNGSRVAPSSAGPGEVLVTRNGCRLLLLGGVRPQLAERLLRGERKRSDGVLLAGVALALRRVGVRGTSSEGKAKVSSASWSICCGVLLSLCRRVISTQKTLDQPSADSVHRRRPFFGGLSC